MPKLSVAHIRQQYIIKKLGSRDAVLKYDLDKASAFALMANENPKKLSSEYVQRSHWYFEDNRIEEEYGDFEEDFVKAFAIKRCEENHLEWENYAYGNP